MELPLVIIENGLDLAPECVLLDLLDKLQVVGLDLLEDRSLRKKLCVLIVYRPVLEGSVEAQWEVRVFFLAKRVQNVDETVGTDMA